MKWLNIILLFALSDWLPAQEKVFYNAKIFTANVNHPYVEAVAINGNKIVAVGSYSDVKRAVSNSAEWVDLKGGFLMPGFVDSHNHAIGGGMGLTKANVADKLMTVDELAVYCKEELKRKEGMTGDVLVIYGLNISTWAYLDDIIKVFNKDEFTSQPIVLRGSDGHTSWCNKVMMSRAGINKNFIQSLGAEEKIFYGITKDGEPNGFITEEAYRKVAVHLKDDIDFHKAAEKAMEYNNRFGITAWLDPNAAKIESTNQDYLDAYKYLAKAGKLNAHIAATIVAEADNDPQWQINELRNHKNRYDGKDFSIIGFKIFADGVIEHPTHTASLSLPYTGTTSKGVLMFDPNKFARFATAADKQNLLVHVHAIGDRAVTETLNGFDVVRKTNGNQKLAHSITHLQIVMPSDFERFKKLNVLASYQLLWAFGDVTTVDIVKPYIDPILYKWQYPARSMLQAGATICGASDWPVSTANPFEAIYNAETRKGSLGVLDSTQCMPRIAMLYAYTSEAAKVLLQEKTIGSLEVGKSADMILLDRDVLTVSAEAMKETQVIWTLFEGKKVYSAVQRDF